MSLPKRIVNRPTMVAIIFMILVGLGLYTATDIAIDLYPEIEPPILILFTDYPGAGPEEVVKSVTRPLEGALSNVGNIENISSVSSEGSSQIQIEFTWGTDMAEASNDVRDKLEFVKGYLPDETGTPQIFKFDPSMLPILNLIITGDRTPEELLEIGEKIVQPRLEQVEGVALTSIMGGRERVVRVEIPQARLAAYDLTITQVANMMRGQNVQISAGSITEGNKNYLIRTSGEYKDIDQIKNTVISYKGAPPSPRNPESALQAIRLRDIADIYEGYRDEQSSVIINGTPGVYVSVQKQSGTNSVRTADNVKERLKEVNEEVPAGISVSVIEDTTKIIKNSLQQVSSSAVWGVLFAVLILFLFLRSVKSTLIVALSIPISIVITLMLMNFFNLTLNMMTLAGLTLGIGMLVDNSIVILENIFRYREKGTKLTVAAVLGSQEMLNAIMASTLTTISVFAPMVLFKRQLDIIGEMISGLAFTVVISLISSLVVAVFLVPVLSSKYLPISSRKQRPLRGPLRILDNALGWFFTALDNIYKAVLRAVLKVRWVIVIFMLLLLLGSLIFIPVAGFEFMPSMGEDSVTVNVELPIGTKLEVTKDVMRQVEQMVKQEIRGYEDIIVSSGERGFFGLGSGQPNRGRLTVILPSFEERTDSSEEVQQKLRSHFNDFPSAVFSFSGGNFALGGSPVDILVKSEDLEKAKNTAVKIKEILEEQVPEITEPSLDLKEGKPQAEIFINRDRAYSFGLNIYNIGQEIKANIDGITASKYKKGGSEYDILVILDEQDRNEIPDLNKIFIVNNLGDRIPLSSIARIEKTTGPISVNRENQTQTLHIQGGILPGTSIDVVQRKVRTLITEEIPADEDVLIEFSGEYEDLLEYGGKFMIILIISVFLVFGVMASQFESFLDPFIIFFTMPLLLIGVVAIYVLTGTPFSIFTAVGLVMLVGIVVNNGIVLVDYTNLLRKRGLSINEACVEAGGNRLRPILMTTLTTILALVPMSFFAGEGAELVQPIGKTVIGGLAVNTVLTLIFIPVLYSLFNGVVERRKNKKEAKRVRRMEAEKEQV